MFVRAQLKAPLVAKKGGEKGKISGTQSGRSSEYLYFDSAIVVPFLPLCIYLYVAHLFDRALRIMG
jgi:hypothetical protein